MVVLPMENCPIRHPVLAILVVPAVLVDLVGLVGLVGLAIPTLLAIPSAPLDLAVLVGHLVDSSWMGAWELRAYYLLAGHRS